jgi:antitoxin (DNA-binding transcriptional repressor) of toxin-antitoxin stability system
MTASEARASLPDVLNRVEEGEEVVITRHGHAVAVVVRPDVLRSRRVTVPAANAARIHELLEVARTADIPSGPGLTAQRAEELIAEIRAGRDRR